jgi:hypothetical protein
MYLVHTEYYTSKLNRFPKHEALGTIYPDGSTSQLFDTSLRSGVHVSITGFENILSSLDQDRSAIYCPLRTSDRKLSFVGS